MKIAKWTIESIVGGVALTLVSGLINSSPPIIGASWYGWPVTWIRKLVIGPQYNPWVIDWKGVIVDFIFWFLLCWLALLIASKLSDKKGTTQRSTAQKVSSSSSMSSAKAATKKAAYAKAASIKKAAKKVQKKAKGAKKARRKR